MRGSDSEATKSEGAKTTIYDVARRAGVSFVSVSRVFNDHPHVSEAMRERVFQAARELGYQSRLVSRPDVVGLLVPKNFNLARCSDVSILSHFLLAHAAKHDLLVRQITLDRLGESVRFGFKGLVAFGLEDHVLTRNEHVPNIPVVLTHHRTLKQAWSSFSINYQHETGLALRAAHSRGHRRIVILNPAPDTWIAEQRLKALRSFQQTHNLDSRHIQTVPSPRTSFKDLDRILHTSRSTCLLNFDGDRTLALADHLLNVRPRPLPGDLSLLTIDNTDYCAHAHPRICSIRQPLDTLAKKAVEYISKAPQNEGMQRQTLYKSTLTLRETLREVE